MAANTALSKLTVEVNFLLISPIESRFPHSLKVSAPCAKIFLLVLIFNISSGSNRPLGGLRGRTVKPNFLASSFIKA